MIAVMMMVILAGTAQSISVTLIIIIMCIFPPSVSLSVDNPNAIVVETGSTKNKSSLHFPFSTIYCYHQFRSTQTS